MISVDELQETFDQIWKEIKASQLTGGQPRSDASVRGVSLAQNALRLATESGQERFMIQAWRMLAYTLHANEQWEDAIPYYQKAIAGFERLEEYDWVATTRLGFTTALSLLGRYQEALDEAALAEKWFAQTHNEAAIGRLYNSVGQIYMRRDEHRKAVEYFSKALDIVVPLGDKQSMVHTYHNLANVLGNVDQFEHADKLYDKCVALSDELQNNELATQASYNRAYLYYLRGRYSDALQSFGRVRQRFEASGSERHQALCDLDEAEIYLQLSLSKDAAILAQRAIEQFERMHLPYEQARATSFYGVALMQMHRYAEALDAFREAQRIFEEANNLYWMGLLDLYRAEVHLSLQRLWEAQALAMQAKATFDQLAIPSKRIFSLVLLGRVAMALNDLVAAQSATDQIGVLITASKVPLVLFPYHLLRAEIAERTRKWDEARRCYELAAVELEQHQARLHHDDLRVTFFKGRQQVYDALVRLSLENGNDHERLTSAYAWCERAKSRGLIELLSHYAPAVHSHAEQSLLSKINRLREELNIHYARSQPELRPISSLENYENIALKEQELANSLREVSSVDPEYASLHQVSIATLETVQEILPEQTTLIEYFSAGDEILAFVVSRKTAAVVRKLCPASRIVNIQERLSFQLEKFQLGQPYVLTHTSQILESTRRRLNELYQYLIAPLRDRIQTRHIAIVPHGTLHHLPFHAFYDGEKYLIDDYEISYAPSASILKYCLEKPDVTEDRPLLVGVPDVNAPLVNEEIERLHQLFPNAHVLRDETATRAAFAEATEKCAFLHIATHAVFRQDNPMFSSFKLSDGWLTAFDLFSMTCQTNLVTLSGCQSGMSEVTGSDDLLGLMRGFLYAGARSLLLSLWNVNDESTTALMGHFYREWRKGTAKSTAFRSAMLAVRAEHPNPFYWAPFLLVGNP